MKVKIVEVGPRDGLQNESRKLSPRVRSEFVAKLMNTGLSWIEIGAFVSPQWVPQMAGTDEVIRLLRSNADTRWALRHQRMSVLVPNLHGLDDAMKSGIRHISIFGACSEAFSKKNINCSIQESFRRFAEVSEEARRYHMKVRGYLSTAFGCPYEGRVTHKRVLTNIERMLELGVYEVSLGDTIGVATPRQVKSLCQKIESHFGPQKIAMHFHDTRGTALANVAESLNWGIKTFDASVGGLGGCPYAKGASGNLSTEDLIYMLHGMKIQTGVDLRKLVEVAWWAEKKVGKTLPSKLARAGEPLPGTLI